MTRCRESVRIILLDENHRILLFLSHFEPGSGLEPAWVFPGGGVEPGETKSEAAIRELFEETGLVLSPSELGPEIEVVEHPMPDTRFYDEGRASFFKVQLRGQIEISSENWTADEHRDTVEFRWWSLAELKSENPWVEPNASLEIVARVSNSNND